MATAKTTTRKPTKKSTTKTTTSKKTTTAQDKLKLENAALKARVKELEKILKDIGKTITKAVK